MPKHIELKGVRLSLGDRFLYEIDHLSVESGDKIGIIGDNGTGKSSLLRLIMGELKPEKGLVQADVSFNYFEQWEKVKSDEMESLNYQFLSQMQVPLLERELMSGGEDQKLRLGQFISLQQGPLILDEPTNYLDAFSINLLIEQLAHYRSTLLIVTHDRDLLSRVVNKIWAIEDGQVAEYIGNYEDYLSQYQIRSMTHQHDHERYIQEKNQIVAAIENKKAQAQRLTNVTSKQKQRNIRPSRLATSKDKQSGLKGIERSVKQLERRLENLELVEERTRENSIIFPKDNFHQLHTKIPIIAHDFHLAKGRKVLIEQASFQFANNDKVAIIGRNGAGKTSFLDSLTEKRQDIFISSKALISRYESYNRHKLPTGTTPIAYLREESEYSEAFIRDTLQNLGIKRNSLQLPVEHLSGGECTRVLLAKAFLSPSNILLLDEPTNFLDVATMEALEVLIQAYPGLVILTSHDRSFVEATAKIIYEIKETKMVRIQ